jgi:hypothetical protein
MENLPRGGVGLSGCLSIMKKALNPVLAVNCVLLRTEKAGPGGSAQLGLIQRAEALCSLRDVRFMECLFLMAIVRHGEEMSGKRRVESQAGE